MKLLSSTTGTKSARLFALYATQGIPFGFATLFVPLQIATREDFSYGKATLVTLASFPWALKALWAPLIDAKWWPHIGRRRSWILPAQALLALTALLASGLSFDDSLLPVLVTVTLLNLWASIQDAAVDAYAVETLLPHERGLGNVAQVAGYKLGMVFGGPLLVIVAERSSPTMSFWAMGALIALLMLAPLTMKEAPVPESVRARSSSSFVVLRTLRTLLRARGWAATLLFIATVKVGEAMASNLVKPWLVREGGFTKEEASWTVGLLALLFSLSGSALGGILCTRMSRTRALAIFGALQALSLLLLGAGMATGADGSLLTTLIALEHFCSGLLTPALFAYMMDVSEQTVAATHYTLLATLEVLGKGLAGAAAGPLADITGVPPFVLCIALLGALPLLLLSRVRTSPDTLPPTALITRS